MLNNRKNETHTLNNGVNITTSYHVREEINGLMKEWFMLLHCVRPWKVKIDFSMKYHFTFYISWSFDRCWYFNMLLIVMRKLAIQYIYGKTVDMEQIDSSRKVRWLKYRIQLVYISLRLHSCVIMSIKLNMNSI